MLGLEERLMDLAGGNLVLALAAAVLLGLRHATDPDHLTAVSTLVLSDERHGPRRAAALGLCWGTGHAASLFAFGLPVILFNRFLPEALQRGAELAIGAVIAGLAVRLLVRWRRGYLHAHPHSHGEIWHSHPHAHEHGPEDHPAVHRHAHAEGLGRSPLEALGIGLVHGVGGSAAAGVLLVAAVSGGLEGALALGAFSIATALSMALVSVAFGWAFASRRVARRLEALTPVFGVGSFLFGAAYALEALRTVPGGL